MALTRGSFGGYEFDRMVVLFSMIDGEREVRCAVSTSAMDDLEKPARIKPEEREAQFMRLRDRIEERGLQVSCTGVRGHSTRHHPAQHRFSEIIADADFRCAGRSDPQRLADKKRAAPEPPFWFVCHLPDEFI